MNYLSKIFILCIFSGMSLSSRAADLGKIPGLTGGLSADSKLVSKIGGVMFADAPKQMTAQNKGDKGDKGDPGPQGPQGPQGPKGDSVSIWCAGADGGPCSCGTSREIARQTSRTDVVTTVSVKLPNGSACTGTSIKKDGLYLSGNVCLCAAN